MTRAHVLGRRGETLAAWLVRLRGGRVLARNLRVQGACEVDIVARYGRTLAVVEVKARRAGNAAEAVGPERVAGLARAAEWLAGSRGYEWVRRVRLDLVTVDGRRVRYFSDAF
jgi:putative endonuclease